jgi:hypothetical protein
MWSPDGLFYAVHARHKVWMSGRDDVWSVDIQAPSGEYVASTADVREALAAVRWAERWFESHGHDGVQPHDRLSDGTFLRWKKLSSR